MIARTVLKLISNTRLVFSARRMSSDAASEFAPPAEVRGMTKLDRERFRYVASYLQQQLIGPFIRKNVTLALIRVPTRSIGRLLGSKSLQEYSIPKISILKVVCRKCSRRLILWF